jgi:hypothetical protein
MSFDRFILAVESCDLSQADKSTLLGVMPIKFTGNYFVTFYTKH